MPSYPTKCSYCCVPHDLRSCDASRITVIGIASAQLQNASRSVFPPAWAAKGPEAATGYFVYGVLLKVAGKSDGMDVTDDTGDVDILARVCPRSITVPRALSVHWYISRLTLPCSARAYSSPKSYHHGLHLQLSYP
ncbi:MAG TPA: hypothetical protein VFF81_01555 [Noviherbaspirillum sp.]|nr:hypothetical protein [Noviherbaspirillum sp.]